MMTIEGLLRLRGSEMDLYSPRYFNGDVQQLREMLLGGGIYLYGQEVIKDSPSAIVVDCDNKKFIDALGDLTFTFAGRTILMGTGNPDWATDPEWRVENPPVPPAYGYTSITRQCNMNRLRVRYLALKDKKAPRYYSISRDPNMTDLSIEGDDLVVKFKENEIDAWNSLFFVNGLCCFPELKSDRVTGNYAVLKDAAKYLRNQKDRKRGICLIDFSSQCKIRSYKLSSMKRDFPYITIPSGIDVKKSSFLLVVDGRIFLPGEFTVFNDHSLYFDKSKYLPEYQLDRMICENQFVSNVGVFAQTRTVRTVDLDLKNQPNSFLVVLDTPAQMEMYTHDCIWPPCDVIEEKLNPEGRVIFDGSARGMLFDQVTRSVVDFVSEDNRMMFYDDSGKLPIRWDALTLYLNLTTPFEMWAKNNNDMSTTAMMHDRVGTHGSSLILWPKYNMFEFIFEG